MGSLRLFLALCVAIGHFGISIGVPTSDIAVQSFFVISGFYMALVLNEKYGPGSYFLFISNRVLRLWPTYAAVLVLSFAVSRAWYPALSLNVRDLFYFVGSQIFIVGQEAYFFLLIDDGALRPTLHPAGLLGLLYTYAPVPQAWTLGFEFYFYLLAPFVVRRGPTAILTIIAGSLVCRAVLLAFGFGGEPWTYRFFPSELALFMTGSLSYHAYTAHDEAQRRHVYLALITVAVAVCVLLGISKWDGMSRLASLSLLAFVILGTPGLFAVSAKVTWDRYLGELSYPLYICHFLVGWILLPDSTVGAFIALAISFLLSIAIYRFAEAPINRWRQNRAEKRGISAEAKHFRGAVA